MAESVQISANDLDFFIKFLEEEGLEDFEFELENDDGAELIGNSSQSQEASLLLCPYSGCKKSYKTKSGLERHKKAKHETPKINMTLLDFKKCLQDSIKKLISDQVTPKLVKEELTRFEFSDGDLKDIWARFEPTISSFNGNAEKFYSKLFKLTVPSPDFVPLFKLSRRVNNVLCNELSTHCLQFLTKPKHSNASAPVLKWSPKAKEVVEYIAGYCFREMFSRLHRKKKSSEVLSLMAILKSAKIDPESFIGQKQRMIKIHDRGGLWMVNWRAFRIFELCEEHFHKASFGFKRQLKVNEMVSHMMRIPCIKSNFNNICIQASVSYQKEITKNLLEKLIELYFRVRSHSKAREQKEAAKKSSKKSTEKSLRTELKRDSEDTK